MSKKGSRLVFCMILILLAMLIIPVTLIYARAEDGQEVPEVQEEVQTEEVTEPTEDEPSFDVMGWFRDELLPAVSTVLISVVGIILANARSAKPVQSAVEATSRQMVSFVEAFVNNKEITEQQIRDLASSLITAKDELRSAVESVEPIKGDIDGLKEDIETLKKVLTLAFANSTELVKKGAAVEIVRLTKGGDDR